MSALSVRWDRSRTRSILRLAVLSLLAAVDRRKPHGIVNLFFHAIPEDQAKRFEELLDRLSQMGPILSMEEALKRGPAPEPAFTISFDDGFHSTVSVAGKILHRRNIPSTVFIASELVGLGGEDLKQFTHERLNWPYVQTPMSVADVRACGSLGMEIGSHGVTHKSFAEMSARAASVELAQSRAALKAMSGQPVRYFAWPFGSLTDFLPAFLSLASNAGYDAVYSGVSRRNKKLSSGVQPRRELNLAWGVRACTYLAVRG